MKRILVSSISLALSVGFVSSAFAYAAPEGYKATTKATAFRSPTADAGRPSRRSITFDNRHRDLQGEMQLNPRDISEAAPQTQGRIELMRGIMERKLRRMNRMPKEGSDRYRTLNLRPNTRYLRLENESGLPPSLVQTGSYDAPTRRDIRDNAVFGDMNFRNRDVLLEMEQRTR